MDKDLREVIEKAKDELRAEWRQDLTGLEAVLKVSFGDLQALFESYQRDRESDHEAERVAWHRRMVGIELELTSVQKHLEVLNSSVRDLSAALSKFSGR